MQAFLPVAGFGPPGIIIAIVGTIFSALFGSLFGGSADANIAKAFNGLRDQMVKMGNALMKFAWSIAIGVGAIFNAIKYLWGNILGPLVKAIRGIADQIARVLKRVLKPIMDAMKAQRAAILDIYNRFLRPIILAIEKIRRIIHLFQLLHIHIFDRLDRTLARIEGKILAPIYALLYRTNTLGNWVSFIINGYGLIYRGLLLGSVNANRGGTFNLLANAPAYGFKPLAFTPDPSPLANAPSTFQSALIAVNTAAPDIQTRFAGTPADQLMKCWETPIGSIDLTDAIDNMIRCVLS